MSRFILVVALATLSTAAVAKHVYPKNLTPVDQSATFSLAENYVVSEKAATYTLSAGTYVQRHEDRKAIYLIGNSQCVEMSVVPPKNPAAAWKDRWDCGIYLPKDPSVGATFFFIRRTPETPHSGNGVLIDGIIKAGYGSFDFPMSNKNDVQLREAPRSAAVTIHSSRSRFAARLNSGVRQQGEITWESLTRQHIL